MKTAASLDSLCIDISCWAERNPVVGRVWLFGSCVRQDFREDSDLDVAIELDASASDQPKGSALWLFEPHRWQQELQAFSPHKIHLEQYLEERTSTIKRALEQSSRLVYQKSSARG